MKKRILYALFLFLFFTPTVSFAEMYDVPENVPIDKEHEEIFDNFVVEFIDKNFEENKTFEDGDYIEQELTGVHLKRIDRLGSNIERYSVFFTFCVKRYTKDSALYTEEFLLQLVYFDIKDGQIFKYYILDAVDISQMMKKEI